MLQRKEIQLQQTESILNVKTQEGKLTQIANVLECEKLTYNLLSLKRMEEKGQQRGLAEPYCKKPDV